MLLIYIGNITKVIFPFHGFVMDSWRKFENFSVVWPRREIASH